MTAPYRLALAGQRQASLLLALALTLPTLGAPMAALAFSMESPGSYPLIARGGGGGGGRGGGGGGGRAGGGRGGDFGAGRSGFQQTGGAAGLNRGASRPTGGWSQSVRSGGPSPSLSRDGRGSQRGPAQAPNRAPANLADRSGGSLANRPAATRSDRTPNVGSGDRQLGNRSIGDGINRDGTAFNRDGNGLNRNANLDRSFNGTNLNRGDLNRNGQRVFNGNVNSNWRRDVNINNVNLSPGWARPGWGYARPWSYGWYGGWATPGWGWWGASAALWGVSALASAAVINAAVDSAVTSNTTYIVVPQTNYQLLYGTVQPSGSQGVTFLVQADNSTYTLTADCNLGTIDGVAPNSAAQAELLNAACQVAYGSPS